MCRFTLLLVMFLSSFISLLANAHVSKEIYREYNESVLLISNEEEQIDRKLVTFGTAFAIDKSGYLVTSAHLVQKHSLVKDTKGRVYPILDVAWIDEKLDLAVLKVAGRFKPLPLAGSSSTEIGEEITVLSNPSGLQNTLSVGILSAKREQNGVIRLQHTSPISPGSSGGPIFNEKGHVIGVIQGIFATQNSQNLNFGVPCEYLPSEYLNLNRNQARPSNIAAESQGQIVAPLNQQLHTLQVVKTAELMPKANTSSYKNQEYAGLLSSLDLIISLKPDDAEAYILRGFVKQKMQDYMGAIQDFKTAEYLASEELNRRKNIHLQALEYSFW